VGVPGKLLGKPKTPPLAAIQGPAMARATKEQALANKMQQAMQRNNARIQTAQRQTVPMQQASNLMGARGMM
jgi:hypothetical protein